MSPRTFPAAICVLALAVAAPAYAAFRHTERSDRVVEAAGIRALEVDNSRGDVQVTPSPDGRLHVTAVKITRGRDRAEAERFAAAITVTARTEGDRYVIRVTYPRRVDIRVNFWDLVSGKADEEDFGQSHELRLLLQAPPATRLDLHSVSGDLVSRDMAGPQRLRTTSGDGTVAGASGAVEIETVSGDARVRDVRRARVRTTSGDVAATGSGPLDARTVSGDIDVEGPADSLALSSTSGDITVEAAPRGITAGTTSGAIEVREARGAVGLRSMSGSVSVSLGHPLAHATVSSSSGDVELGLLPGLDASLDLSTSSGDIACDVPVVLQGHGRQHMNAKYGRGGAAVKAHTVSGDLHVTSGGR